MGNRPEKDDFVKKKKKKKKKNKIKVHACTKCKKCDTDKVKEELEKIIKELSSKNKEIIIKIK